MKLTYLCVLFLSGIGLGVMGQNKVIRGRIYDSENEPVNWATVSAKDTKLAVVSNIDGLFSISVPSTVKTLIISSVGFLKTAQAIDNTNKL